MISMSMYPISPSGLYPCSSSHASIWFLNSSQVILSSSSCILYLLHSRMLYNSVYVAGTPPTPSDIPACPGRPSSAEDRPDHRVRYAPWRTTPASGGPARWRADLPGNIIYGSLNAHFFSAFPYASSIVSNFISHLQNLSPILLLLLAWFLCLGALSMLHLPILLKHPAPEIQTVSLAVFRFSSRQRQAH